MPPSGEPGLVGRGEEERAPRLGLVVMGSDPSGGLLPCYEGEYPEWERALHFSFYISTNHGMYPTR